MNNEKPRLTCGACGSDATEREPDNTLYCHHCGHYSSLSGDLYNRHRWAGREAGMEGEGSNLYRFPDGAPLLDSAICD